MAVSFNVNIDKIVFTSPNMPSPSPLGTRSHIIPGTLDLGTWYESGNSMYNVAINQDIYDTSYSQGLDRPVFGYSGIVASGTTYYEDITNYIYVYTEQDWPLTTPFNLYLDDSSWFEITDISQVIGAEYNYVFTTSNWQNRIKEVPSLKNSRIYRWGNSNLDTTNSVIFTITFGEAYDCYLTAWDDITHSTTDNTLLQYDCYRISACAFTSSSNTTFTEPDYKAMYYEPKFNITLKGNTSYYGKFNINYEPDNDRYGAYIVFKPILINLPTTHLTKGRYDFVTSLHYKYT